MLESPSKSQHLTAVHFKPWTHPKDAESPTPNSSKRAACMNIRTKRRDGWSLNIHTWLDIHKNRSSRPLPHASAQHGHTGEHTRRYSHCCQTTESQWSTSTGSLTGGEENEAINIHADGTTEQLWPLLNNLRVQRFSCLTGDPKQCPTPSPGADFRVLHTSSDPRATRKKPNRIIHQL